MTDLGTTYGAIRRIGNTFDYLAGQRWLPGNRVNALAVGRDAVYAATDAGWGRWDPEYFLTDEGRYDRGLQAVELLSFIRTAEALTGDAKFSSAYRQLVGLGYPAYTLRERNTFPPDSVLHFLDELSFWTWWNLLRYETDPELHALYRRGYERGYEVVLTARE